MWLKYAGFAASLGDTPAPPLAAAPTLISTPAFVGYSTGAASHDFSTAGIAWLAGDIIDTMISIGSSPTRTGAAGSVDDTSTERAAKVVTAKLYLDEWTVVGGSLDATFTFTLSGSSRAVIGGWSYRGATARATAVTADGTTGPLVSPAFVVTGGPRNVLAMAALNILGSHITNAPTAPAGYTIIDSEASTSNSPTLTSRSTLAVAYRTFADTDLTWVGGEATVPAATWGGAADHTNQAWGAISWGMLA